jgi:hypothetical protein
MNGSATIDKINIRPGVSILSILKYLNYKPWFALAEFVDNSLQSYFVHREALINLEGSGFRLRVQIELDSSVPDDFRITIRDNAAGINLSDYARAFRPAAMPSDRSGFAEYGMGMKSAACWFAPEWTVRSKALGETEERFVAFNIAEIVTESLDELTIDSRLAKPNDHYAEIILSKLHKPLQARTIGKIKEHLASIYRVFIREGILELTFDRDVLIYTQPTVLSAPYHKALNEAPRLWKKELDFDFGLGLRAHGFAALRETSNIATAGFALFRRNRLIQGSADEGYRPKEIFGSSNKFTYQRLFGELHLEGFEVSHTKDGFRWDENEEAFLGILKEVLVAEPLPLIDQAEGHRARLKAVEVQRGTENATRRTALAIEHQTPPVIEKQRAQGPDSTPPPTALPVVDTPAFRREIPVIMHDTQWLIILELTNDPSIGEWVSLSDQPPTSIDVQGSRRVGVRLSIAHPFTERFAGAELENIEPLLRIAAAIGLSEIVARDSGVKQAGTLRRNINELLRDALSRS